MSNDDDIYMYDAQTSSIKMKDIASKENNRLILSRIKRNNADDESNTILYICDEEGELGEEDYVPEGAKDMGWVILLEEIII